jgi:hypothetical protein
MGGRMSDDAARRMGLAGIVAGVTFFVGQGGELVVGDDSRPLLMLAVGFVALSIVSFGVAFLAMRSVLGHSRSGRIGATTGVVGIGFLLAFAVQLVVSAVRTGEVPQNFILFAIGFLLVFVAHLVVARPLAAVLGGAWWLSVVAAVALLAALVTNEVFIWHDLGLFVFEGCWVAVGVLAVRQTRQPATLESEPLRT